MRGKFAGRGLHRVALVVARPSPACGQVRHHLKPRRLHRIPVLDMGRAQARVIGAAPTGVGPDGVQPGALRCGRADLRRRRQRDEIGILKSRLHDPLPQFVHIGAALLCGTVDLLDLGA